MESKKIKNERFMSLQKSLFEKYEKDLKCPQCEGSKFTKQCKLDLEDGKSASKLQLGCLNSACKKKPLFHILLKSLDAQAAKDLEQAWRATLQVSIKAKVVDDGHSEYINVQPSPTPLKGSTKRPRSEDTSPGSMQSEGILAKAMRMFSPSPLAYGASQSDEAYHVESSSDEDEMEIPSEKVKSPEVNMSLLLEEKDAVIRAKEAEILAQQVKIDALEEKMKVLEMQVQEVTHLLNKSFTSQVQGNSASVDSTKDQKTAPKRSYKDAVSPVKDTGKKSEGKKVESKDEKAKSSNSSFSSSSSPLSSTPPPSSSSSFPSSSSSTSSSSKTQEQSSTFKKIVNKKKAKQERKLLERLVTPYDASMEKTYVRVYWHFNAGKDMPFQSKKAMFNAGYSLLHKTKTRHLVKDISFIPSQRVMECYVVKESEGDFKARVLKEFPRTSFVSGDKIASSLLNVSDAIAKAVESRLVFLCARNPSKGMRNCILQQIVDESKHPSMLEQAYKIRKSWAAMRETKEASARNNHGL